MMRILILVAISLFLCSTASAFQGGGGKSTEKGSNEKQEVTKKPSGTKSDDTTIAQERQTDACTFCGVWEYVDNFSGLGLKYYLKISQVGAGKFKFVTGQYQEGEIYWAEPYIRKANGIYLTMVNGRLVGRFVSSNFYPTHGTEFTYKVMCAIQSDKKLSYSVWSSIRGETETFVATRISN